MSKKAKRDMSLNALTRGNGTGCQYSSLTGVKYTTMINTCSNCDLKTNCIGVTELKETIQFDQADNAKVEMNKLLISIGKDPIA